MIVLVTGTDTGVGKTFFTVNLLKVLLDAGREVSGLKIVETGCDPLCEDAKRISEVCGEEIPPIYSFRTPVAPSVAERLERKEIDIDYLKSKILSISKNCEILVAEGAGGIMVPISGSYTFLDLAREVADEVLIVALNKLGVINHTLLTVEVCKYNNIPIRGVFLNNYEAQDKSSETNFETLSYLLDVPVYEFSFSSDFLLFVNLF
ncbi:dethiobiotin synthase [Desulfurobacterium indicum]|uniref:ATP-dependent dethiobiotin synthetase BioD n=1 Tax=Desulfurobacterium indicum TaxID=1914305 RepID=A0A1R1MKV5_9BACT|nr:dethiobiotin synthase [Desulfurobacterium indicum]OMH40448.1 dethiobiotin synthase [Desulfurobacterium indicum]